MVMLVAVVPKTFCESVAVTLVPTPTTPPERATTPPAGSPRFDSVPGVPLRIDAPPARMLTLVAVPMVAQKTWASTISMSS